MNITIDTETRLFKPGYMAPKVICLSRKDKDDLDLWHHESLHNWLPVFFRRILHDKNTLSGHNVAYDMACLYEHYPETRELIWQLYDQQLVHCTLYREKLLDLAQGKMGKSLKLYSLGYLIKKHFEIELDKDIWRMRYHELEDILLDQWPEGAIQYAIDDAKYTYDLFALQEKRHIELKYEAFHQESARQASYAFALQLTMCRGMEVDSDRIQKLCNDIEPKMKQYLEQMREHKLLHTVGKKEQKNTKLIKVLVEKGYPENEEIPRTPKGSIKTDAETLQKCNHPGIQALVNYKKLEKLNSDYLKVLKNAQGSSIHPSYDVLKETGRTSSSRPNIQNQPRKGGIRECFIPRDGFVFIFCDYDSQEMRTLAETCYILGLGSALGDRYNGDPDFDPHTFVASELMKIPFEEAMALKDKEDSLLLERRQQCKAANFGYAGGMGAATFVKYAEGYGVDITMKEAEELKRGWFEAWPEMRQYFNIISNIVDHGGTIHQVVSGRIRGGCIFTSAANTFFQALASDVSKFALFNVAQKCFDKPGSNALVGCRPVAFIHDEVGIEAPLEYAPEAARKLERTMIASMETLCTHVPARASATIMSRWSKDKQYWLEE